MTGAALPTAESVGWNALKPENGEATATGRLGGIGEGKLAIGGAGIGEIGFLPR